MAEVRARVEADNIKANSLAISRLVVNKLRRSEIIQSVQIRESLTRGDLAILQPSLTTIWLVNRLAPYLETWA